MKNHKDIKNSEFDNSMRLISGDGNIGYLWEHIDFYEKKLPKEIAPYEEEFRAVDTSRYAYQHCHYFSAWIRLFTELICNKVLVRICRVEYCKKNLSDYGFLVATDKIIQKAKSIASKKGIEVSQLEEMVKCLKLTIELRHSFQHGGVPGIIREKVRNAGVDLKDVTNMVNPKKYRETKKIFYKANELIEMIKPPNIAIRYNPSGKVVHAKIEES